MLGAQVVVRSSRSTSRREAEVEQVGGAEVDRDADVVAALGQRADLLQRAIEHERGQRAREAALLDQRQEVAGAEQPALGVLPAHERLDAAHGARPQLGLRLVVQDELAGLERGAELADEREPLAAVVVAAGEVDLVAGAHALGLVHRDVGALQQPHASRACSGKSAMPTLASTWTRMPPTAKERSSAARSRSPAVLADASSPGASTTANSSPPSRASVSSSRRSSLQARADLAQHLVARVVAERVVELLEAVEVDQQQRELGVVLGRGRDRGVQRVDEVAAVAEAGEVVGARLRARSRAGAR